MTQRDQKVPDVVVRRLPLYLRVLEKLDPAETPIISSGQMATLIGSSPGQVRKDLSYFGVFGRQGVGYQVVSLQDELRRILKLHQEIRVGLIGAGNLGAAIVRYHQRSRVHHPLEIVALFDIDPKKIGRKMAEVEVYPLEELAAKIEELQIKIMVLTFPALDVQEVVDTCINSGIRSILNFVPAAIKLPPGVKMRNSDVTLELQSLAYYT